MSANWTQPCALSWDGEEAWCATHLAELVGEERPALSSRLTQLGAFVPAGKRLACDARTRGKVVPQGTVLSLRLDERFRL